MKPEVKTQLSNLLNDPYQNPYPHFKYSTSIEIICLTDLYSWLLKLISQICRKMRM